MWPIEGIRTRFWGAAVARGCDGAPAAWLPPNHGHARMENMQEVNRKPLKDELLPQGQKKCSSGGRPIGPKRFGQVSQRCLLDQMVKTEVLADPALDTFVPRHHD